jgi:seryl-tRNA synthetase
MLDIKFIRQYKERVQEGTLLKNFPVSIHDLLILEEKIRHIKQNLEEQQAMRNALSKEMASPLPLEEKEAKKNQVLHLKKEIEIFSGELSRLNQDFTKLMLLVAQPPAPDVPTGKDDQDNLPIRIWGQPKPKAETPLDHMVLGERLRLIDFERGVKIAGSRSFIFTGIGALLEQAILRLTYDRLVATGFTPLSVPVLVKEDAMEGTGYFPLGRDQAYLCERDQMALIGTSEVPLCSYHRDEILPEDKLPLRYMALTPCFRREAGSYGKDTKGLYRVHQFHKIEMVILGKSDEKESLKLHDELLSQGEWLLQALELPYRVVYVCTGDLGQGQVRKHDLETWMPSRNSYGETHSCSTFHDFQSRRLQIRYRENLSGDKKLVYTLNNTACATPRIILALLENHQTPEGTIKLPKALWPYMGGMEEIS